MSSRLKIVTIGPFPPLRGGISDFHEALVNQISKKSDIKVLNFKSLYPKIFFPGKSEYGNNKSSFKNVNTILNPLNILSWIKGKSIIKKNNTEISIVGGAGHVGFPLGLVFANKNFKVNLIDRNNHFLKTIEQGTPPFLEKGAKKLLNKCLKKKIYLHI